MWELEERQIVSVLRFNKNSWSLPCCVLIAIFSCLEERKKMNTSKFPSWAALVARSYIFEIILSRRVEHSPYFLAFQITTCFSWLLMNLAIP